MRLICKTCGGMFRPDYGEGICQDCEDERLQSRIDSDDEGDWWVEDDD